MADEDNERIPNKIVALEHREWLDRQQLSHKLDVDRNTFDQLMEADHIETKHTARGTRFRYVGPTTKTSADNASSERSQEICETEIIGVDLSRWTEARQAITRLESRLDASREDIRRAVDYAQKLEEECDRLADLGQEERNRAADIRSELDEERGRRRELEQQYRFVVEKLEEMSGVRGRYHLERGRRESAEEQSQQLSERVRHLEDQIQILNSALEEAREQGFRIELGKLLVEFKR